MWILEGEGIACTIFKKSFWTGCRERKHLMLHCFWDASISHNIKIWRKVSCPPPMYVCSSILFNKWHRLSSSFFNKMFNGGIPFGRTFGMLKTLWKKSSNMKTVASLDSLDKKSFHCSKKWQKYSLQNVHNWSLHLRCGVHINKINKLIYSMDLYSLCYCLLAWAFSVTNYANCIFFEFHIFNSLVIGST